VTLLSAQQEGAEEVDQVEWVETEKQLAGKRILMKKGRSYNRLTELIARAL
jgi:hypothetical protein